MIRRFGSILIVIAVACGGKTKPAPAPAPTPPAHPDTSELRPTGPDTPPATPDHEPTPVAPAIDHATEIFPPAWTKVGVGQTISFSVAAIDQDLDEIAVGVTKMPPSATFDPITQTVTWTPTKADMPAAEFAIGATVGPLTWNGADVSGTKAIVKTFSIAVVAKKQPAPVAPDAGPVAEELFTIRQAARLEQVNKDWPFDAMLAKGAELMRLTLPAEAAAKLPKVDKAAMFKSFLKSLAATHKNPRLDPDAPEFDKKAFGDPKSWRIIAVRPRLDKKFEELRIVYMATRAPEPVFAMFRVRPVLDIPTLPPEARAFNNKAMLSIVAKRLFDKNNALDPRWAKDARGHGKAVAALVKDVLTFEDKSQPWAHGAFVALPTEARMGGGSARRPDGGYASGDGWAWSVQKPMPSADGASQAYVNIGIPGFWTDVAAAPDGKSWAPKCAPRFDPDNAKHAAGFEVLCRKAQGFVDLPDETSGKPATGKLDAENLYLEHKRIHSVAMLPLDDGRRDLGEENGMTCAQCHIRNFGVHTYADKGNVDPGAGKGTTNHALDTLNFQIVPTDTWQAFTLEFMQDQECKAAAAYDQMLQLKTSLGCPLAK